MIMNIWTAFFVALSSVWFCLGFVWFLCQLDIIFNSNIVKAGLIFVDCFIHGNLACKVLYIITVILFSPWISLLFMMALSQQMVDIDT